MGMVRSYLTSFAAGLHNPFAKSTLAGGFLPHTELAADLGSKHGRWLGRWLHGKPTQAMIYKIFVMFGGVLFGLGYVCIDQYYRPLTGLFIGTIGLMMFVLWGVTEDDLR